MSQPAVVVASSSAMGPDESRLLEIIVAGRRAAARLSGSPSADEARELRAAVRAAEDARALIVKSHQGLVAKLARRYRYSGVPMADLMQEGNIGLLAALDRFDPDAGRFASFAWYWVRQMMLAAIPRNRQGFCLSSGVARQAYRVRKTRDRLESELGREASSTEVSAACGLSVERVESLESLNAPHHPLSPAHSADLVNPAADGDPSQITSARVTLEAVRDLLDELPDRERLVIRQRYGLTGPAQRLTEVAEMLGVTPSRVCQIEHEALQRLRRLAAGRRELLLAA